MTRKNLTLLAVAAGVVLLAGSARADLLVTYDGSFSFTSAVGYYSNAMTVLPNGFAREAGSAVAGPTIVTFGSHTSGDNAVEWTIPTLSKTSAGLNTAGVVGSASNGTSILDTNAYLSSATGLEALTEFSGRLWGQNGGLLNNWSDQLVAVQAGVSETWSAGNGGSSDIYNMGTVSNAGSHTGFGIAPKRDESNVLLTMRNDVNYRNFIVRATWDPDTETFSNQSAVFDFVSADDDRHYDLEYIDIDGAWYYVVSREEQQGLTLMLFDAATSGASQSPDFTFTVGDEIANGAGWYYTASQIQDLAWDDVNNVLYVLDSSAGGGGQGGRVHAFSFETTSVPEPTTMALLAVGGGLLGLPALRRRRRRRV